MTVRNLNAFFGTRLAIFGTPRSEGQHQVLRNLETRPDRRSRDQPVDPASPIALALVLEFDHATPAWIEGLGARGCKALVWMNDRAPDQAVLEATRIHGLRVLGPGSVGVIDGASGQNLSALPVTPARGTIALIGQSQSIAAAALDWAVGRGIGLSWLALTGAEVDVDVADLLDRAALDPGTRSVVLQLSRIAAPRKFMSAARAVSRIKPVLVLQTPAPRTQACGCPDPVRSAAFLRSGLIECESMRDMFEGLAALDSVPSVTGDQIAVVGNGAGVCALATSEILRQGLQPAVLSPPTRQGIMERLPEARVMRGAVDLGQAGPADVIAVLKKLLADPQISAILLIRSPLAGLTHETLALSDAGLGGRVLTVWLGLQELQAARQISAAARLPTFASTEEAVSALRIRMRYRDVRNRLGRTPPSDDGPCAGRLDVRHTLAERSRQAPLRLSDPESVKLLEGYGLATWPPDARVLSRFGLAAWIHPEVGMVLRLVAEPVIQATKPGFALPPLDGLLARRLIEDTGPASAALDASAMDRLGQLLVRVAQMSIEQPHLSRLELDLCCSEDFAGIVPGGHFELTAEPLSERQRIALAPYPESLSQDLALRTGRSYRVRVVRPSDEPAVLRLLERLDPEEVRLRFFSYIRHFSHDMAARVTQVDYDRELTLVACPQETPAEIAAMATFVAEPDGVEAEFALLVHHEHVRSGLGHNLLQRLIEIARIRGVRQLHGDVLAENAPMLSLSRACGFSIHTVAGDPRSRLVTLSFGSRNQKAG